jgi:chromosome segregation ATPase
MKVEVHEIEERKN